MSTTTPVANLERLSQFAKEQVDFEAARRMSIQQRGITVLSTSGTLVALLFAFTSLIKSNAALLQPKGIPAWVAMVALVFFVASAFVAFGTLIPRGSERILTRSKRDMSFIQELEQTSGVVGRQSGHGHLSIKRGEWESVWETWSTDSDQEALKRLTALRMGVAYTTRQLNNRKNKWLEAAIFLEVIAVLITATAAAMILLGLS